MKVPSRRLFLRMTVILTASVSLLLQVVSEAENGQSAGQESKLISRADLYIRDPFVLPDPETKLYYLYKSMDVSLKDGQLLRIVRELPMPKEQR